MHMTLVLKYFLKTNLLFSLCFNLNNKYCIRNVVSAVKKVVCRLYLDLNCKFEEMSSFLRNFVLLKVLE